MNDNNLKSSTMQIQKGDTFVQYERGKAIIFMVVNSIEDHAECIDIYKVSWYILDKNGLNVQSRFLMAARDGEFTNFVPIPKIVVKEARKAMRQCHADLLALQEGDHDRRTSKYSMCRRKLIRLIK